MIRLTALVLLLPLSFGVGCRPKPAARAPEAPPPVLNDAQIIQEAVTALRLPGVPSPPLSTSATRAEREAYLVATEKPRAMLAELVVAEPAPVDVGHDLYSPNRTEEISVIANALAVQLADAIDRGNADAAKRSLYIAFTFADKMARVSVADAVASGAVADALCLGIHSAEKQLNTETVSALRQAAEDLHAKAPDPNVAILNTLNRIKAWAAHVDASKEDVSVEQALMECTSNTVGSRQPAPDIVEALRARSSEGKLVHAFRVKQANLVAAKIEEFLNGARSGSTVPFGSVDSKTDPLAALCLSALRPTMEAAPKLAAMREENLRLVVLTARIIAADNPSDLSAFGDDAKSPVSGMAFEYRKSAAGFDLIRPRKTT